MVCFFIRIGLLERLPTLHLRQSCAYHHFPGKIHVQATSFDTHWKEKIFKDYAKKELRLKAITHSVIQSIAQSNQVKPHLFFINVNFNTRPAMASFFAASLALTPVRCLGIIFDVNAVHQILLCFQSISTGPQKNRQDED